MLYLIIWFIDLTLIFYQLLLDNIARSKRMNERDDDHSSRRRLTQ